MHILAAGACGLCGAPCPVFIYFSTGCLHWAGRRGIKNAPAWLPKDATCVSRFSLHSISNFVLTRIKGGRVEGKEREIMDMNGEETAVRRDGEKVCRGW